MNISERKKIVLCSETQAERLWKIARSPRHRVRPWGALEFQRFLKHHGCVDAQGRPSRFHVPLVRGDQRFYDWIAEVVAGPVPSYCLDPEEY